MYYGMDGFRYLPRLEFLPGVPSAHFASAMATYMHTHKLIRVKHVRVYIYTAEVADNQRIRCRECRNTAYIT